MKKDEKNQCSQRENREKQRRVKVEAKLQLRKVISEPLFPEEEKQKNNPMAESI